MWSLTSLTAGSVSVRGAANFINRWRAWAARMAGECLTASLGYTSLEARTRGISLNGIIAASPQFPPKPHRYNLYHRRLVVQNMEGRPGPRVRLFWAFDWIPVVPGERKRILKRCHLRGESIIPTRIIALLGIIILFVRDNLVTQFVM